MPSDFALKMMNTIHRGILAVTFGKAGWSAGSMPVLELTTIGRKSGQPRSVMLTSPVQPDDGYVIVASKGGEDTHPAWFLNLRDNSDVEVSVKGGPKEKMTATIIGPEDRAQLWPEITRTYKGYAGYQEKTDREIPLVLLTPRS